MSSAMLFVTFALPLYGFPDGYSSVTRISMQLLIFLKGAKEEANSEASIASGNQHLRYVTATYCTGVWARDIHLIPPQKKVYNIHLIFI